jgi:hypothetical protein
MTAPQPATPPRPTALPLIAEAVPVALTSRDQWVLWDWTLRDGKDGPVWTKPPLKVVGTGNAKSNDREGWGSFRAALNAMKIRRLAGIGFALAADDPFTFGDIDDCRDPETGVIADWAMRVIERFRASYIEVSPSGTGIKILIQGRLPEGKNRWKLGDGPGEYIEWFSERKYTTLTGHRLETAGTEIVDCQAELDALAAERAAREEKLQLTTVPAPVAAPVPSNDDDDALLLRARQARNGANFYRLFYGGDTSPYGNDDSAADLALCDHLAYWCGPDPARIDRLFRRSKLYRDKWDRDDYRERTIAEALKGRTQFARASTQPHLRVVDRGDPGADDAPSPSRPQRKTKWNAAELLATDLPDPRWAVPDLIPEGMVILAGRPKKGKSLLALSAGIGVASGTPVLGFFDVYEAGEVLFVALEDFERRLQDRLGDMLGKRPAPPNLEFWTACPRIGQGFKEEIEGWLQSKRNPRLIVLDTYQRVRPVPKGGDKNTYAVDYEDAAELQKIAIEYRVSFMLIQHTRKPVAGGDPFDEIMGTTGNSAAADALMVLQTERGRADAKLFVTGRDLAEAEHAMSQDPTTGKWIRIGDANDLRRSEGRQTVLTALRTANESGGLTPREIADFTKQRVGTVRSLLSRMKHVNEVVERSGRYFVAESENMRNSRNSATLGLGTRFSAPNTVAVPVAVEGDCNGNGSPVAGVAGVAGDASIAGVAPKSWECRCGWRPRPGLPCPQCGSPEPVYQELGQEIWVCPCGTFVPEGGRCHVCGKEEGTVANDH